jgi:hypothetical protein
VQHSCSIHVARTACHFSPQLLGGMTFFRPVDARGGARNSSIGEMETVMNALGLNRKEWVFNVLGLLVLLALGVVG